VSAADRYKPRDSKPWPVCTVCGLAAPDVRGTPSRCPDAARCVRVVTKFPNNKQAVLLPEHLQPEPPDSTDPKAAA
jgi:hypothetical protein